MRYLLFFLALLLPAKSVESKVKLRDLPPAVQAAVKERSQGAILRGLSKEVEDGVVRYEAELKVKGRTRDVTFDESGKLVCVEEEIFLADVPAAARAAIEKAAAKGKLKQVESITEGGVTKYEAHIRRGLRSVEFKCDAAGGEVK